MGVKMTKNPPGFLDIKTGVFNFLLPFFGACHKDPLRAFGDSTLERVERCVNICGYNCPIAGYAVQFFQDLIALFPGLHVLEEPEIENDIEAIVRKRDIENIRHQRFGDFVMLFPLI